MDRILFIFSLWLAKIISFSITVFHIGQASNFAGKIALSLCSDLLKHFRLKDNCKIVLISGTNGKSTSCGMLSSMLKATGKTVISNKSGANLLSGIANAFCYYSDLIGNLDCDYLILEVDEATLPLLTEQIAVDVIAITNFFRDQLDRFGELDTTVKLIEKGIGNSKNAILVLNSDDPRVAFLKGGGKRIYYGLHLLAKTPHLESEKKESWLVDPEEVANCPNCSSELIFTNKFLAHLGDYKCSKCNLKRPQINFAVSSVNMDALSTNFDVSSTEFNNQHNNFFYSLIGVFNLYNALCAISIAKATSNITTVQIQKGFQLYSTIFGRGEKIVINDKVSWVYLIKNPSGATEVLKTLCKVQGARFLIAINDNLADGRDISWLWDVRFDILASHKKEIYIAGKRAPDMALRLKYANVNSSQIKINKNVASAINSALKALKDEETLYILPTYTVLLEMQRKKLCKTALLT